MSRRVAAATLIMFVLSGCSYRMYPGPDRPNREIAFIATQNDGGAARLIRVDDVAIEKKYSAVKVLPGPHTLDLRVTWSNRFSQEARITLDAKAGGAYFLSATEYQNEPIDYAMEQMKGMLFWYSLPVSLPAAAIANATTPPPATRPAGHWIDVAYANYYRPKDVWGWKSD